MKAKIAQAIKDVLIQMAINGELDQADLTQLDTSKFDEALKPVDELTDALSDMTTNADEDCPAEYRTEHFREAMDKANDLLNQ